MPTKGGAIYLAISLALITAGPKSGHAEMPSVWRAIAPNECTRLTEKAWQDFGWPVREKAVPAASCDDFETFSSSVTANFLIHQDEYTGGGGFYRWFVLEDIDERGHPRILAQDTKTTARFVSIASEKFLERYDGTSISLSRWRSNRLQIALKYHANEFAFQSGPVFGALRAFDPETKDFYIVKYEAHGRDAILNRNYAWSVDRYSSTSGNWLRTEANLPFSKKLKTRLRLMDRHFSEQLASVEQMEFNFDEDFGRSHSRRLNNTGRPETRSAP